MGIGLILLTILAFIGCYFDASLKAFLGEDFDLQLVFGGILVLISIWAVNRAGTSSEDGKTTSET